MVECQACGGRYAPLGADGMQYFHACPPLSSVELAAAVDAGAVALPKGERPEDAIQRRSYERANKRDENVTGAPPDNGEDAPIKSHGAGVLEVADVNAAPVVVATPSRVATTRLTPDA